MTEIKTKPATKEYRKNWDKVFKNKIQPQDLIEEHKRWQEIDKAQMQALGRKK